MVTSPYLHPALNTLAALLLAAGALIGVVQGADATVTQTLFGPGSTMLAAEPRAFWAWWLIILGAVPFIVWQWLPKLHDPERLVALTWPALVAGAGQLAWVLLARAGQLIGTGVALGVTLVALCLVVWRLAKFASPGWVEHLATDLGWGAALGWVCVELLLFSSIVFEHYGLFDDDRAYFIAAIISLCVFIAGALGLAGRMYRQLAVGLVLTWGIVWIGWERLVGEPRSYILGALAMFGAFLVLAAFYASSRRRRRNVLGLEERPWD